MELNITDEQARQYDEATRERLYRDALADMDEALGRYREYRDQVATVDGDALRVTVAARDLAATEAALFAGVATAYAARLTNAHATPAAPVTRSELMQRLENFVGDLGWRFFASTYSIVHDGRGDLAVEWRLIEPSRGGEPR